MSQFTVKPLEESTWDAFANLVEKHKGVWGGCWCIGFHKKSDDPSEVGKDHREMKHCRVMDGRAHAALVFDGDLAVGWCQFGPTRELTRIKHRKEYESKLQSLPDWRITCFFVDKHYRNRGVASIALQGALELISSLGGGVVESYPQDISGKKTAPGFIYNASLSIFERHGFEKDRPLGKSHWVVRKVVRAL